MEHVFNPLAILKKSDSARSLVKWLGKSLFPNTHILCETQGGEIIVTFLCSICCFLFIIYTCHFKSLLSAVYQWCTYCTHMGPDKPTF